MPGQKSVGERERVVAVRSVQVPREGLLRIYLQRTEAVRVLT